MKRLAIAAVAVVSVAVTASCSSSTSPNSINVAGNWTLSSTDLSGGGLSCTLTGPVQFIQSGHSLSGNLPDSGITTACVGNGGSVSQTSGGTAQVSGTINASSISFSLANGAVQASGTATASAMSGSSVTVSYPGDSINVSGTWTAAKVD